MSLNLYDWGGADFFYGLLSQYIYLKFQCYIGTGSVKKRDRKFRRGRASYKADELRPATHKQNFMCVSFKYKFDVLMCTVL